MKNRKIILKKITLKKDTFNKNWLLNMTLYVKHAR